MLVGVAVGGTVVGVGVGMIWMQSWHGGSNVTRRFTKVIVWPLGVWFETEVALMGANPGEAAFTGFSLTT